MPEVLLPRPAVSEISVVGRLRTKASSDICVDERHRGNESDHPANSLPAKSLWPNVDRKGRQGSQGRPIPVSGIQVVVSARAWRLVRYSDSGSPLPSLPFLGVLGVPCG